MFYITSPSLLMKFLGALTLVICSLFVIVAGLVAIALLDSHMWGLATLSGAAFVIGTAGIAALLAG